MTPLFLCRRELGAFLGMPEDKARAILEKHGVKPIDISNGGKIPRLRWRTSAVIKVADTLYAEAQTAKGRAIRKPKVMRPLRGKSAKDLYAEFNQAQPPCIKEAGLPPVQ